VQHKLIHAELGHWVRRTSSRNWRRLRFESLVCNWCRECWCCGDEAGVVFMTSLLLTLHPDNPLGPLGRLFRVCIPSFRIVGGRFIWNTCKSIDGDTWVSSRPWSILFVLRIVHYLGVCMRTLSAMYVYVRVCVCVWVCNSQPSLVAIIIIVIYAKQWIDDNFTFTDNRQKEGRKDYRHNLTNRPIDIYLWELQIVQHIKI